MSQLTKHIYIAYTGGTIGMKPSNKGYIPAAGYLTETLGKLPEFHRAEMPEFTIHEYVPLLDSSDMEPADWQQIADDIQANYEAYDGFIILHGTDTMAYTASALSFMLEGLQKPVIVTGSQIPLAQLRSDGQANLLNALYVAANYPIPEVTLFFNNKLLRGNRSRKVDADGFDAFDSPNAEPLLIAGIHIETDYPVDEKLKCLSVSESKLKVARIKRQPVGLVSLYPGFSHDILSNVIRQPVKAVILMTYGVGNAPQQTALLNTLKSATSKEILVVNCTQCLRGSVDMSGYANGVSLNETGVVSGKDITPEAALAKLHYLLSRSDLSYHERARLMSQDLRGELTGS
ncbi:L-asparaginase 1 [Agaribacter marinus]|uniref:L-asparaginase 1 n=1 Tax=Agaribacter marinus TaxID=1431249 RepID=A0AA37SX07_9ALTE|nr:L-asparaginase 1 [Agaribacter marinus]